MLIRILPLIVRRIGAAEASGDCVKVIVVPAVLAESIDTKGAGDLQW
ncbi:hypothetical protein FHS30_002780 [Simiduia aestuariiviva]|uniref:Uncharacterized protein n=1 Tax=Simiduia aestuariiviva TaxID=1510459 RepID=A0A839UW36_9GAMM|nr:hypothetical protein [Simiduia aestuariiviva]